MKKCEDAAREIVAELFRNGAGEEAERLVLEGASTRDLGGWNREAVRTLVVRVLEGAEWHAVLGKRRS